ncbi:hypothetical protein CLOSTMETH_00293 [[Clostridium] methylpentosum DSM 5476]|uniref:Uncharacterized protein n=1 Tax=[Clostridium] methylpentosum DSM 5476 TaxID=537013 RepID=C0E8Z8_9FIRM|nr:hypothetical protein CLOSTMETH_00293 [[Clostridium] methylpentosum DSM 5476]
MRITFFCIHKKAVALPLPVAIPSVSAVLSAAFEAAFLFESILSDGTCENTLFAFSCCELCFQ